MTAKKPLQGKYGALASAMLGHGFGSIF